jgi:hypothetical protein
MSFPTEFPAAMSGTVIDENGSHEFERTRRTTDLKLKPDVAGRCRAMPTSKALDAESISTFALVSIGVGAITVAADILAIGPLTSASRSVRSRRRGGVCREP